MNTQPLISVIIPVYRTEQYLRRCVQSVCAQTYSNLEIILVDDGSPDQSGELCDRLARADSRIRVIHKKNGGLSSARNAGLDAMSGRFVGFVDSDDWIEPEMYELLLTCLRQNGAAMAACGMVADRMDGKSFRTDPNPDGEACFGVEEALCVLTKHRALTSSLCDKLFASYIFRDLRMTEGTVNEDFELMPRCIELAGRICYTPNPMYHYVMTANSIMRSGFTAVRFTESDMSRKRAAYYACRYPKIANCALAEHAEVCLNLIAFSRGVDECGAQRKQLLRELPQVVTAAVFWQLSRKNRLKFLLCRLSPALYGWVMGMRSGRGKEIQ